MKKSLYNKKGEWLCFYDSDNTGAILALSDIKIPADFTDVHQWFEYNKDIEQASLEIEKQWLDNNIPL